MNIQNLLKNWKTTSSGIASISASVIHLIFSIRNGTANEQAWEATILGILVGCGLLFAGDASQSADASQVATLQRQVAAVPAAIETGNTSLLKKTVAEDSAAPNTPQPIVTTPTPTPSPWVKP